jgi:hypothetical protein
LKVVGLDGRQYTLDLREKPDGVDEPPRSGPHLRMRQLLRRVYPLSPVIEEVTLPGTGGLRADFFLPHQRAVVEVHGVQHTRFVAHFHRTRSVFLRSVWNDRRKVEWCNLNGLRMVVVFDGETADEWYRRVVAGRSAPADGVRDR